MSNIGDFGNGIGLLYVTETNGTSFIMSGLPNDDSGVNAIKIHALSRAPISSQVAARGNINYETIATGDSITDITINGVSQISTTITLSVGDEITAAIDTAIAINNHLPVSGVNYTAFARSKDVIILAPSSAGATVNGHVVATSVINVLNTVNLKNVDNGSDGEQLNSTLNGARYFMNASLTAIQADLSGSTEITNSVIMRGLQSQASSVTKTISSSSVFSIERISQLTYLNLEASGAENLDSIDGDFSINDEIRVINTSAFDVTVRDQSISTGNIVINPTSFVMTDDDKVLSLRYVDDPVLGLVWKEVSRNPQVVGANSITEAELAANSVSDAQLQTDSVTTIKIADLAITTAKMALLAVDSTIIASNAVLTAKINDLAVTTAKMALISVDSTILADNAVTTNKINAQAVTTAKLANELTRGFFTVPISFETGELGIVNARIPFAMTVTDIQVSVSKLIEATDDATFIPKDNAGTAMTGGQIDLTAGAPIGNDFTSTPSANNTFSEGQDMKLETLKSNPGGKGIATVFYTRT